MAGSTRPAQSDSECESSPHRIVSRLLIRQAVHERIYRVESGYFERSLDAYGREGAPCHRCGTPMRREQFMNRSSFSCPKCQVRPRN